MRAQGIISILFTLTSVSTLAIAQPIVVEDQRVERRVSYADLNLQTQEGQNTLNHRVREATHQVCLESGWTPYESSVFNDLGSCERAAFNKAQSQMDDAIIAQSIAMRTIRAAKH